VPPWTSQAPQSCDLDALVQSLRTQLGGGFRVDNVENVVG
jgi:hypothetical protein